MCRGKIEAKKASAWARNALECVGFVVHEGKSVWLPSLYTAWFGFNIDLEHLSTASWDSMQTWNGAVFRFQKLSWQHCMPCCRSRG